MSTDTPRPSDGLLEALALLDGLTSGSGPTAWIGGLESRLKGADGDHVRVLLEHEAIAREALDAALLVKRMSGQINVLVHAIGIANALPYILEPGETVTSLSLGAGNTGRAHDLETDRRIAEFKFITWRGGAEAIRQNGVFADLFNLASATTDRRRVLYLVGAEIPLRFLCGRRALTSIMSHEVALTARFRAAHGDQFRTVGEYYATVKDKVEVVDLVGLVPGLGVE